MQQGIARSTARGQALLASALSPSRGLFPQETTLPLQISAFWVKNITLHNIASAQVLDRPCFCSSSHAPNCTCTHSRHR
jgi:hypothetical protein